MDKILIIDDDKPICVTLAYALEDLYSVKWTQDGAAGVGMVRAEPPDLVLLDLRVGRYNGIDLLKEPDRQGPGACPFKPAGQGPEPSAERPQSAGKHHRQFPGHPGCIEAGG